MTNIYTKMGNDARRVADSAELKARRIPQGLYSPEAVGCLLALIEFAYRDGWDAGREIGRAEERERVRAESWDKNAIDILEKPWLIESRK